MSRKHGINIKKRIERQELLYMEFYGYKASIANSEDSDEKWRPSIHMPKEAVRIWLKVIGVRVERLQDITEKQKHLLTLLLFKSGRI